MEKNNTDLNTVATVGLDLAKHVFQVHAVDLAGRVVTNRALRRKDVLAFFERLPSCPSLGSRTGKVWP
jgi:transposase